MQQRVTSFKTFSFPKALEKQLDDAGHHDARRRVRYDGMEKCMRRLGRHMRRLGRAWVTRAEAQGVINQHKSRPTTNSYLAEWVDRGCLVVDARGRLHLPGYHLCNAERPDEFVKRLYNAEPDYLAMPHTCEDGRALEINTLYTGENDTAAQVSPPAPAAPSAPGKPAAGNGGWLPAPLPEAVAEAAEVAPSELRPAIGVPPPQAACEPVALTRQKGESELAWMLRRSLAKFGPKPGAVVQQPTQEPTAPPRPRPMPKPRAVQLRAPQPAPQAPAPARTRRRLPVPHLLRLVPPAWGARAVLLQPWALSEGLVASAVESTEAAHRRGEVANDARARYLWGVMRAKALGLPKR